jgi:hypothetical protein
MTLTNLCNVRGRRKFVEGESAEAVTDKIKGGEG